MKSIFGVSLSDEGLFITYLLDNNNHKDLLYTGKLDYPFEYRDDIIFDEVNFLKLSDSIIKQREERQIEDLSLFFVLPSKYAYLKRVAFPKNSELSLDRFQIEWDINTYISGDIAEYKIIQTDHIFEFKNYDEKIIIAIKKTLIKTIAQLANACNAELGAIVLNNYAIENFINANRLVDQDHNQLVFRVGKNSLESHFFLDGHYHSTLIDNLNLILEESDPMQKIIRSVKENYNYFLNLVEKMPPPQNRPIRTMVYGTNLTEDMFAKLKGSFSDELIKLEIEYYPEYLSDSHHFIEAYGAAL